MLLDLADEDDYYIVTQALRDFAHQAESDADNEDESDRFEGRPSGSRPATLRAQAERARAITADVERQLDANGAARRPS
ncbi:hypothetical protein ASF48_17305 [Rathayibacter sp. Leaf299]|uniref:hypothetical protein n=1 Tax=Rathayibacter sp. Leaf299 TaxID=1736328 RepID=UPI0007014895|nr:hypothetical protein [Rathayibacter sp. Leaf299]KQQ18679.1 hypothetical protein ASF48_17305 [Rathayibacter sp. Leaf299]